MSCSKWGYKQGVVVKGGRYKLLLGVQDLITITLEAKEQLRGQQNQSMLLMVFVKGNVRLEKSHFPI